MGAKTLSTLNKIDTLRFYLKSLTVSDVSERYLGWLNTDVSKFIVFKQQSLLELEQYVSSLINDERIFFYGIFHEVDGHIGNVKFELKTAHVAEMGILIGETQWHGKGVAKEVILAFAQLGKKHLDLDAITLGVDKAHYKARSAYEKIGFKVTEETEKGFTMMYFINKY